MEQTQQDAYKPPKSSKSNFITRLKFFEEKTKPVVRVHNPSGKRNALDPKPANWNQGADPSELSANRQHYSDEENVYSDSDETESNRTYDPFSNPYSNMYEEISPQYVTESRRAQSTLEECAKVQQDLSPQRESSPKVMLPRTPPIVHTRSFRRKNQKPLLHSLKHQHSSDQGKQYSEEETEDSYKDLNPHINAAEETSMKCVTESTKSDRNPHARYTSPPHYAHQTHVNPKESPIPDRPVPLKPQEDLRCRNQKILPIVVPQHKHSNYEEPRQAAYRNQSVDISSRRVHTPSGKRNALDPKRANWNQGADPSELSPNRQHYSDEENVYSDSDETESNRTYDPFSNPYSNVYEEISPQCVTESRRAQSTLEECTKVQQDLSPQRESSPKIMLPRTPPIVHTRSFRRKNQKPLLHSLKHQHSSDQGKQYSEEETEDSYKDLNPHINAAEETSMKCVTESTKSNRNPHARYTSPPHYAHQTHVNPKESPIPDRPVPLKPQEDLRCRNQKILPIVVPQHKHSNYEEPRQAAYRNQSVDISSSKRKDYHNALLQLRMENYKTSKLTLKDVLNIGQETLKSIELNFVEHLPWYFLQNLMALNWTARNTTVDQCGYSKDTLGSQQDLNLYFTDESTSDTSHGFHPLDVLCVLLHCSDSFLQQEILSKMSMCQFAVPLLLPGGDDPECTLMLWAMRDIVKRWRPQSLAESKGFIEDSLVHIPMPTFSFVRLGNCNLSKSKVLNQVLSQTQSSCNFFVNIDMECGSTPRKISDGLVEISWYFPGSMTNSETFPEPIAVTNLRGDLESNWTQFTFLSEVSSAVFIFAESISEKEFELLSRCRDIDTNYYFITATSGNQQVTQRTINFLKNLLPVLKLENKNVIVCKNTRNVNELVKKLQHNMAGLIQNPVKRVALQDMATAVKKFGVRVDENSAEYQNARAPALEITKEIKEVITYKKKTMKLQGEFWKELSKIEKEMCRMSNQGSTDGNVYKNQLQKKLRQLRAQQSEQHIAAGMARFINAMVSLSNNEKLYFFKWMKYYLDSIARINRSVLQAEHKEIFTCVSTDPNEMRQLHQRMSESSLGVEHFLREIGQLYESEYFMTKENKISKSKNQFSKLPGIAADLLLGGFPLELIDGDVSNIPMQWVTDVLTELNNKTGGHCRMRVITVLGVQSTGKSTLLNTMFGLQFPVSSGRCTRGAFMTLINVKENFKQELGCDFILVIDTEGLKAPELASLEGSYEHDNELATFVVGLSDITIVNMAMEHASEMKNTLQIVVHAFLRMNEIGKKPICQLVHQNVSDVTAYANNMTNRETLLQELNEMTKIAAKMEKKTNPMNFSDIIDYHPDKHNWYIPGLWYGVPPMAPINHGYSEHVFNLKKHLFQLLRETKTPGPQDITSFIEWVNSLWSAVKYETFIFSFRNSLVAEAYEQLSMKYSELEWNVSKKVQEWLDEKETFIKNQPLNQLDAVIAEILNNSMKQILDNEEQHMTHQLTEIFNSGCDNVHLVVKYRDDFFSSVKCLRLKLEVQITNKCTEAFGIQNGRHEIQSVQQNYLGLIEEKVANCLKSRRWELSELSDAELKDQFEIVWKDILSELQMTRLKKHRVDQEMLEQLKREMRNRGSAINEKLQKINCLKDYGQKSFDVRKDDINIPWLSMHFYKKFSKGQYKQLKDITLSLTLNCQYYAEETVNSKEDYTGLFCQELLNLINDRLAKEDVRKLHTTASFELEVKLYILGKTAPLFQKMHDDFGLNNDPKLMLNKLKPHYFSVFKNVFQKKDESKLRAKKFCEECLKPAVLEYINNTLGKVILDDVLKSPDASIYKCRTHFQYNILKELLEFNNFQKYLEFVNAYEVFLEKWIFNHILNKYKYSSRLENLQLQILSSITIKIKAALKDKKTQTSHSVADFLRNFCTMLNKYLVISQNAMNVIAFQNKSNIGELSTDIEFFLTEMENQIRLEMKAMSTESVLSHLRWKPESELFKKVIGCGMKCPFCCAPCEAEGVDHKKHFVTVHRPKGLSQVTLAETNTLSHSICSTDILCKATFPHPDKEGEFHRFKDYRTVYPEWIIHPDRNMYSSDYWKFVLKEFNGEFAKYFYAEPANLPKDWHKITMKHALRSLKEVYKMK